LDDWASLAAGLANDRRRDELLEHARGCDVCGAVLRAVVEDFSEAPTAAESQVIRSLESATLEWQRAMSRRMSKSSPVSRPVPIRIWLVRAAAVLVAVGAGWVGWTRWKGSDPAQLIARAYTAQRPFEFRMPGAAYAPMNQTRRGNAPFERSQSLLDAEAAIKRELAKNPDSVQWLAMRARAEMLERSAEDPIQTLQHALEQKPDDPDLLADLGIAYALRAEQAQNHDVDYGYAIEYISRSLEAKPNVTETMFNRALVYRRMYLIDDAIREWKHYLDLDRSGAWREEAQHHLSDVERKKRARQAAVAGISKDPDSFLKRIEAGDNVEAESYQDVAIKEWLPRRWENPSYERALAALATRLQERHSDKWLLDVMAARRSDALRAGLQALAEAVKFSSADESEQALPKSQEAVSLLQSAGGGAASLRAKLEEVFALHRNRQPAKCLEKAIAVERAAKAASYSWILAQSILEQGVCRGGAGDPGEQQAEMTRALLLIRKAGYGELQLRAESMLAGAETNAGNLMSIWRVGRRELATYWDRPYAGTRGAEIYYNLMSSSRNLDLPESAYVLQRAAVTAFAETQLHRGLAFNAAIAARLAVAAGRPSEAQGEFQRSATLFDQLQQTRVNLEYRTYAELYRAEAEVNAGAPRAAVQRLEAIRASVEKVGAALVRFNYYKALGDSEWRSGRVGEAEAAYRQAIDLNEHALPTLPGPRQRAQQMLGAADAYRGLVQVLWDRGDVAGALRLWEWFRGGDQPGPRSEPDLDQRRLRLQSGTFLTYVLLPGGPVAWLFNDREIEARRLNVKVEALETVAARFLRECADPASDRGAIRRDARQLYDWLLAPFAGRLDPSRTLVIESEGPLGAIPMQALMGEDSRFLGERFVIAAAGGLADYQRREAAGRVNTSLKALIVANPSLGEETSKIFPPLVGAMREGSAIAERFPGAWLLSAGGATLRAVEQYGPQAEVLHFAGHGFSNAGNGGLLLSPGTAEPERAGILDGARMAQKDWSRCRLAVLSACSTGAGEARGPVNPESLVRGLLWAGVARVVASRWNMDSETGVTLMDRFYDALLSGDDVAKALQKAARSIRENTATSHPYFWAGYQNFGAR
jgi:CHAT domain-containing protein